MCILDESLLTDILKLQYDSQDGKKLKFTLHSWFILSGRICLTLFCLMLYESQHLFAQEVFSCVVTLLFSVLCLAAAVYFVSQTSPLGIVELFICGETEKFLNNYLKA